MRRVARRIGTGLLFLVVGLCLLIVCVPPFLDRIYYRGPASDHFDGARFFNPEDGTRVHTFSPARMLRFLLRRDRAEWPEAVPVPRGYPPADATLCPVGKGVVVESWARCVPRVDPSGLWVTWIGHATTLVQAGGLAILTDPIWSDRATPLLPLGPKRARAPGIRFEDLPKIDVVLVSHNHYDHMDLVTLKRLWQRDRPIIVTSLGNDTILRRAGVPAVARDWGGRVAVRPGVEVVVERVHHWGSRWGTDRNRALWSGFTVVLPGGNVFFAGDTGFGDGGWADQAATRGTVRLAILPIGAFLPREVMRDNHTSPGEAITVFERLGAANALAMHWGTFQLSDEPIDAPREVLAASLRARGIAPSRFRAIEVGVPWQVPPLR